MGPLEAGWETGSALAIAAATLWSLGTWACWSSGRQRDSSQAVLQLPPRPLTTSRTLEAEARSSPLHTQETKAQNGQVTSLGTQLGYCSGHDNLGTLGRSWNTLWPHLSQAEPRHKDSLRALGNSHLLFHDTRSGQFGPCLNLIFPVIKQQTEWGCDKG